MERKIQLRKSLSRSQAYVGRVGRTDPNDDKRPLRTLTPFSRATPDPAVGTRSRMRSRAIRRCASRRHFRFCPANSHTIQGMFRLFSLHWKCEPGSRESASLPPVARECEMRTGLELFDKRMRGSASLLRAIA